MRTENLKGRETMKRLIILNIILSIILLLSSAGIIIYHLSSTPYIHDNIYIEHVPVSNLSKETAEMLIESKFSFGNIAFEFNELRWDYSLNDLGYRYDIRQAVQEAYEYGRERSALGNSIQMLYAKYFEAQHIPLRRHQNFAIFDSIFLQIQAAIDTKPQNAQIHIGSEISIIPEIPGRQVDMEKLSYITKTMLAKDDAGKVIVPVTEKKPQITKEYLRRINGVIGQYSTVFPLNAHNRAYNIRMAASSIDNTLMLPGEVFSFYEKTKNTHFRKASVLINKKVSQGIGGGICQVSSTLYNSVLYSNLKVTERHPHSIPSSYVPLGRDATVYGNLLDFKFENNKDYPIYIRSYVHGNRLYILIYGDTKPA